MSHPMILYLEDDPNSIEVMHLLLVEEMGYPPEKVVIWNNSIDFMARLDQLAALPDLFLLDIHLGPHDGFQILKLLRNDARFATHPVVALTASVMNEEVDQLRRAGFDGVIAKPIDIDVMPSILQRVMNGEHIWYISG